jgi:hypothetical protein
MEAPVGVGRDASAASAPGIYRSIDKRLPPMDAVFQLQPDARQGLQYAVMHVPSNARALRRRPRPRPAGGDTIFESRLNMAGQRAAITKSSDVAPRTSSWASAGPGPARPVV